MSLTPIELTRYRGDGSTLSIPLINPDTGAAFTPTGYVLLFTAKKRATSADTAAVCQKISSVGGITVANPAVVTLVANDFGEDKFRANVIYEIDVQAQPSGGGSPLTVRRGTLFFAEDVSKELTLSIDTYTTSPSALATSSSYNASANSTGNTTVTTTSVAHMEVTTVTGLGDTTRIMVLAIPAGQSAGSRIAHRMALPETGEITIEWRNATAGGALITSMITDAIGDDAVAEFYFDGAAWQFLRFANPSNA